jgi:hypothetical protein|tara:strand:+ start:1072 stop:1326 length:255 start_codon:yes stop_codon:yes gene_type:complete
MAKCIHGEESLSCIYCKIERDKQQFGNQYSDQVGTSLKGKRVSKINYNPEDYDLLGDAIKQDEMAKEFVLKSFPVEYKSEDEDE